MDCVPAEEHAAKCLPAAAQIERTEELAMYLCPRRRISFDGFVSYEGRRFGVPYWYPGKTCRVSREGELVHVYADDLSRELAAHPVTWSRKDSFCADRARDHRDRSAGAAGEQARVRQVRLRGEAAMTAAGAGAAGDAPATALYRRVSERAASLDVGISPEELAELAVRLDMGETSWPRSRRSSRTWRTSATTR